MMLSSRGLAWTVVATRLCSQVSRVTLTVSTRHAGSNARPRVKLRNAKLGTKHFDKALKRSPESETRDTARCTTLTSHVFLCSL